MARYKLQGFFVRGGETFERLPRWVAAAEPPYNYCMRQMHPSTTEATKVESGVRRVEERAELGTEEDERERRSEQAHTD